MMWTTRRNPSRRLNLGLGDASTTAATPTTSTTSPCCTCSAPTLTSTASKWTHTPGPDTSRFASLSLFLDLSGITGALFRLYQPGLPLRAVRLLPGLALPSACCHRWLTKGG